MSRDDHSPLIPTSDVADTSNAQWTNGYLFQRGTPKSMDPARDSYHPGGEQSSRAVLGGVREASVRGETTCRLMNDWGLKMD